MGEMLPNRKGHTLKVTAAPAEHGVPDGTSERFLTAARSSSPATQVAVLEPGEPVAV